MRFAVLVVMISNTVRSSCVSAMKKDPTLTANGLVERQNLANHLRWTVLQDFRASSDSSYTSAMVPKMMKKTRTDIRPAAKPLKLKKATAWNRLKVEKMIPMTSITMLYLLNMALHALWMMHNSLCNRAIFSIFKKFFHLPVSCCAWYAILKDLTIRMNP